MHRKRCTGAAEDAARVKLAGGVEVGEDGLIDAQVAARQIFQDRRAAEGDHETSTPLRKPPSAVKHCQQADCAGEKLQSAVELYLKKKWNYRERVDGVEGPEEQDGAVEGQDGARRRDHPAAKDEASPSPVDRSGLSLAHTTDVWPHSGVQARHPLASRLVRIKLAGRGNKEPANRLSAIGLAAGRSSQMVQMPVRPRRSRTSNLPPTAHQGQLRTLACEARLARGPR
jgi:hypothetical protein